LVEDEQERMQIAQLNLKAARAAHQATAFETGLNYAQAGIELLSENTWNQDYLLTLELHERTALLAHAAGDIPSMEHHSEQVLQFGRDPLDLARVQRLHIEYLLSSKRFDEAIDFGLKALRILGEEFPSKPDMEFTVAKLSEFLDRLEREPADYFSLPRLYDQDPELLAVSEILFPIGNAAFISRPALAPLIYMRRLELSLERQLLPEHTPGIIAIVGVYAHALLGKVEVAHTYGETAVELTNREAFHTSLCVTLQVHGLYSHFWRNPLRETLDFFERGIQSAHDYGNNEFVAYMSHSWSKHAFYASSELAQVEERCLRLRTFIDGIQYITQSRWINIYVTAVQALCGNSSARGASWGGTPFNDDRDLPDLKQVEDQLGLLYVYCAKAWVATLFGDHEGVEEYSDLSCSFQMAAPTGLEKAILTFIFGLRHARELRVNPDRPECEQALQEQLDLLERFAGLAPMNFAHKLSLVQAEVHRARGEVLQAMQAYEQAAQGARENDYLNEAGLAYALAAEFFQDLGLRQAAIHNAEQAAQAWRSWGAHALVENLRQRLPDLLEPTDLSEKTSNDVRATQPITPAQLDLESITSATQLLSAETDLEQLSIKMMSLVMANSGAERAVLLLKRDKDWFVGAQGDITSQEYEVLIDQPFDPADPGNDLIPESVFNYCRRTAEELLLGDAPRDERFVEDGMIRKQKIQSIACIPAISQGELKAILYLENRQTAQVFTPEAMSLLKHLSAQFAISVENALLYQDLNQKVRELKEAAEQIQEDQDRLRALVAELTLSEERERRRIATELHDGAAQLLAFARIQLSSAKRAIIDEEAAAKLGEISFTLKESLQQIREVLLDLSSPALNEIGLSAALSEWLEEQVGRRHGLATSFVDESGVVPLENDVRALLFRSARELIMNCLRHAEAKSVAVRMASSGQTLRITVEDDGRGFDPEASNRKPDSEGGFGLFSVRERMSDLGGQLEVESAPGKGCRATLVLPLGSGTLGRTDSQKTG
jgi:signal transduction histidine kinase